jgi:hypothetical protein
MGCDVTLILLTSRVGQTSEGRGVGLTVKVLPVESCIGPETSEPTPRRALVINSGSPILLLRCSA